MSAPVSDPGGCAVSADLEAWLENLQDVEQYGVDWTASCPAHGGDDRRLKLQLGRDGTVIPFCPAGCSPKQILAAMRQRVGAGPEVPHGDEPSQNGNGRSPVSTGAPSAGAGKSAPEHPFFRFFRDRCGWDSGTFRDYSAFSPDSALSGRKPPPMRPAAFHGIAGAFVRAWDPATEACKEALLLQFLAAMGNLMGPGPYIRRGADFHRLKLNVLLIGHSSDGAKGSSLSPVLHTLRQVDESWWVARFTTAVSGEGIVKAVRDASYEEQDVKKAGVPTGERVRVLTDGGSSEKRLLVTGTEFSAVLKACRREGCTLSDVIRLAWDDDFLQVPTKNFPYRATGCHITICGHITPTDLVKLLSDEDQRNGFGNRFLWAWAWRAKSLPRGGCLPDTTLIVNRLKELCVYARAEGELMLSSACEDLLDGGGLYEALRECARAHSGELLSRAAPYALRIAGVYALLDESRTIEVTHLRAALAVWEYCEASVHHVFPRRTANPLADCLLAGLRACPQLDGPSRSQIGRVFGDSHPKDKEAVDKALQILTRLGLAKGERVDTGGRPRIVWEAQPEGERLGGRDWSGYGAGAESGE